MNYQNASYEPTIGDSYGNGWKMLWKNFLELLLIGIIALLFGVPISGFSFIFGYSSNFDPGNIGTFLLPAVAYGILVMMPITYGVYYAFLKAVRGENVEIRDMFIVFRENYLNAILAYILVQIIVGIGFALLIIPGIIFACKLAFVPFLVTDRKMEAMDALKTSWRMTDGYAMNIFLIAILAIFIVIGGMIVFFVGVIISAMWIYATIASIYYAVDTKINPVEEAGEK
jgi:hypothetical protein